MTSTTVEFDGSATTATAARLPASPNCDVSDYRCQ